MKKIIIPIVIIIIAGVVVWWFVSDGEIFKPDTRSYQSSDEPDKPYEPSIEADQQFGFLIGPSSEELELARETGAGWVRPHPGLFVWHYMQKSANSSIDFSETDKIIKDSAKYDINILPTLWHYAEWDQKANPNADNCIVSGHEFQREFGQYRCNPYDWDAYTNWVTAVVERYDGDGVNDMPDLTKPITHWEIMNEPDIRPHGEESGLQFFVGQPADYAELLKKTSQAIKVSDPNAQILIAGAAGGNKDFLDFFRGVFKDQETHDAFDIANVHCITSDDIDTFNVKPYTEMLAEFNIDKPIWVTEAEAFVSQDHQVIGDQLLESSKSAFSYGAKKIFFTSMNLGKIPGGDKDIKEKLDDDKDYTKPEDDLGSKPEASTEIYQTIFNSL